MLEEGIAREVVNKIQKLRKKVSLERGKFHICMFNSSVSLLQAGLKPTDPAEVFYDVIRGDDGNNVAVKELMEIITRQNEYIESSIKLKFQRAVGNPPSGGDVIEKEVQKMKGKVGSSLSLWITRIGRTTPTSPNATPSPKSTGGKQKITITVSSKAKSPPPPSGQKVTIPACKFVNVAIPDGKSGLHNPYKVPFRATVLLENPSGTRPLSFCQFEFEVSMRTMLSSTSLCIFNQL